MRGHLVRQEHRESTVQQLRQVLGERNHWRAFALTILLAFSSFTVIPYITLFTTTNLGLTSTQVPLIYLVGGLATLISSQRLGQLADRWGKAPTFRLVALLALAPILALPQLGDWGLTGLAPVLVVTTLFFVLVSGRMVPGMALVTSAVEPGRRGAFMSLNNALQSGAMGLASLAGGLMVSRDAQGLLQGYGRTGWVALACTAGTLWLVGRLRVVAGKPGA